ncbi:MAG: cardiolipin synthase [Candidatus Carbobacillus altaicus]|uniref:Cardiolipin synthase n=1 Tax=Candidatus Carbonibacillus altaicus TaxID=2163959 RepID=A0A2R6Y4E5_9BACL|nr:cardiolipin synthase [Candidatus Carbobacillus altaicus]PTQ57515.1 MAG: Cardiolipin synthetase [Candidatus Carbobacillus altaicus]
MEHVLAILAYVFILSTVLIGVLIIMEKRNPAKTIAWLLVLFFLPVVGFILYLLFGRDMRKKRLTRDKKELDMSELEEENQKRALEGQSLLVRRLIQLGETAAHAPVTLKNKVDIFVDGNPLFDAMLDDLKKARHHIHLAYYIVRDDELGRRFLEVLLDRAEHGVTIRFMYDHVGSVFLSRSFRKTLQKAGVEIIPILPVTFPIIGRKLNFRYHRKITIVDGRIGYLGGFNIGDEYVGKNKRFGFWRDTHLRVEGQAVHSLQYVFREDWEFASGKRFEGASYFPDFEHSTSLPNTHIPMQLVASGPDSPIPAILHSILNMIGSAEQRLWITTPYLVPDESVLVALKTAALSGVDVRIVLPSFPDHKLVYHASTSYIGELLINGVRIYRYHKGFLHAKVLLVDEDVVSVGTANMDARSFYLNFEANYLIYDPAIVKEMERRFEEDFLESQEINLYQFIRRPLYQHALESVARLFSPIM